jgi:hypothetical protein
MAIDWPWGEKPNDDIRLVLKVAKGEENSEIHDKIIVKGMSYIKNYVDLKAMVKEAYFQKTRFLMATKKFSKIDNAEQLVDIAGQLKNAAVATQRYRDKILVKGVDHIKTYEQLLSVVRKAEYNTVRNGIVKTKFVKVKNADQLIEISKTLRNEFNQDWTIKAAYRDLLLYNGAKKIAKTKADVIKISGAAETDAYQKKILRIKLGSSSGSAGGSAPAPAPEPSEPGDFPPAGEPGSDVYGLRGSGCEGGSCPLPEDPEGPGQGDKAYTGVSERCALCNGTGKLGLKTCPGCHGAGWSGPMMMAAEGDDDDHNCGGCGGNHGDKCNGQCTGCGGCGNGGNGQSGDKVEGDDDDHNCGGCGGHHGDKCNGQCTGCGGCGNGGNNGQGDKVKSAYFDKYLEEALKARILRKDDDEAKKLLIDIFRQREVLEQ